MLYKFKYPKLTLLIISIILSYFLFTNPSVRGFIPNVEGIGYLGVFIAGILLSFGFTAPLSVGFLITLNPENIILSAFIGAIGASISNLLIFSLIRFSFQEELSSLEKSAEKIKMIRKIEKEFKADFSKKIRHYFIYFFIGILVASPLSDEVADALLAGLTKIKPLFFFIFSFILHFMGILILLWI